MSISYLPVDVDLPALRELGGYSLKESVNDETFSLLKFSSYCHLEPIVLLLLVLLLRCGLTVRTSSTVRFGRPVF